jgi:hypothetical protein
MYFSTSFSDIKTAPLDCQIPVSMVGSLVLEGCKSGHRFCVMHHSLAMMSSFHCLFIFDFKDSFAMLTPDSCSCD